MSQDAIALGGTPALDAAPYQVLLTLCDGCGRTWQDAGGDSVELPAEVGGRAMCDAQILPEHHVCCDTPTQPPPEPWGAPGRPTDAGAEQRPRDMPEPALHASGSPKEHAAHTHVGHGRASQKVPSRTRREVIRRDSAKCQVPGCGNHVWLEVHYLRPRGEGGNHAHRNLVVLCGTHHAALHRGFLLIEGSADSSVRFRHADGTPYGEAPRPADVDSSADSFAVLRGLGFSETESRHALAAARTHVGTGASAEALVTAALRLRSLDRAA